jgi:hypothetical protein
MKVARHNLPGESADRIRPVGNGLIRGTRLCSPSKTIGHPRGDSSYRTLRDGFLEAAIPGILCLATFVLSLRAKAPSLKREHDHLSPPP